MNNKERRIHTLIGTCLAAALPCLGQASPPSDAAVGQIDAILNFCANAVPSLGQDAEAWRKLLTGNASPAARSSQAYQDGYRQISDSLASGNHGEEVSACVAGITLPEHHHHDAHDRGGHERR